MEKGTAASHFSSKVLRVKFGEHTQKKTHKHQSTSLSNPVLLVFWSYVVYSGRIKERAAEGGSISLRGKDHQPTHKSHLAVAYQNQKKTKSQIACNTISLHPYFLGLCLCVSCVFLSSTYPPTPFRSFCNTRPVTSTTLDPLLYTTTHDPPPWRPMLCTCACVCG